MCLGACRGQKRQIILEMELQVVVRHLISVGNWTQVLYKGGMAVLSAEPSLQPATPQQLYSLSKDM